MLGRLRRFFSAFVFDSTDAAIQASEERETRRKVVLEKIVSLGKSVTEVSDLKTTLSRIWQGVHDDLGFDRTAIFLYNPEQNSIEGTFGTSLKGEMVEEWEYSRSLNQTDPTSFMRVLERPDGLYFTHNFDIENQIAAGHEMYGVKDYVAVAAWAGNKPVAIISGDNVITERQVSEKQLEMLRLFAGYAGLAIQNAKLYTEIQQELNERKLSEERYRAVVENQTEFIVRWKPDGTRTFVNDAYCRYFDITPEQAIDTSFMLLVAEEDRRAIEEKIARLNLGTLLETDIHRVIKPDGSLGWQEWTDQAIQDKNGQVVEFQSVGRDITGRKQAEQKYRAIFENATEGIFQTAPDGMILTANPATARIFGYASPDEFTAAVPNVGGLYVDPAQRMEFRREMEERGGIRNFEIQARHKSGTQIWVSISAHVVRDANGSVLHFEGFIQDVTERKRAEATLRESEERYRAVVENQTEFIVRWKPDGMRTFVNDAYCRYFGLTPEQAVSTSFFPLIIDKDRPAMDERISRLLSGIVNTETYVDQVTKPDSSTGWQEWTDIAIRDESGRLIEFQSVGRDITEHRKADEALRNAEQKYRAIFENATEGIFQTTPDARMLTANPALARIFGYDSPEEFITSVPNVVALYADSVRRGEFRSELEARGEVHDFEAQAWHKSGKQIWVSMSARAMHDAKGSLLFYEGFMKDVTERKQAEATLREGESKIRAIFNTMSEGVALNEIIYDENGEMVDYRILEVNQAFYSTADYIGSDVIGNVATKLYAMSPDIIKAFWNSHKTRNEVQHIEYYSSLKDSNFFISTSPFINGRFVTSFFDITERKRAEASLQQYAKRMEILHEIDRSLLSARSSREIASGALSRIRQLMPCLRASVTLFDFENGYASFLAADFDGDQVISDTPVPIEHYGLNAIDLLRQDKPWFTNDMVQELQITDVSKRLATEHGIRAWLSLPLLSQGELIGALNLGRGLGQTFTTDDADLVREVADQIAIVIQQNRLLEETQRQIYEQKLAEEKLRLQAEQMSALYDIGLTITSNLDLDQILHDLFEKCRQLLPLDTFYIAVYDESSGIIRHPLFYDGNRKIFIQVEDRNIETAPGLSGYVIRSKMILYLPNADDPMVLEKHQIVDFGVPSKSYVGVPMLFHDTVVGVISMHKFETDAYSTDQIRLLETIAIQAAIAIENARLYQVEQERRREAETLRESLASIVGTFEFSEIVQSILDQIRHVVPYDSASIWRVEGKLQNFIGGRDLPSEISMPNMKFNIDSSNSALPIFMGELPFVLNNNVQEERADFRESPHNYINSWLAVPLKTRGNIIGLIALDGKQKNQFNDHHADLAVTFADQVAIALENASLYSEIQQELAERKRVEESLRDAEVKYRELVERLPAVVYTSEIGSSGAWYYVSPQIESMLNFTPEEWMANPNLWYQQIHPEDRDRQSMLEDQAYASGEAINSEYRIRTRDGREVWVRDTARILPPHGNGLPVVQGVLVDITERKRAEESLRANEEKVRELNTSLEKRVVERTEQLQAEKARIEQVVNEVATLRRLTDFLQASMTLDEASKIIVDYMSSLFPKTTGGLYLVSDGFIDLTLVALWQGFASEKVIQPNDCWGMRRGRSYVRHNSDASPACVHFGANSQNESLCLPLLAQNEIIGMLCIQVSDQRDEKYFSPEVQNLAIACADSIALALANLRLRGRLHNQSVRDPLTGLFNRRYLEETLARETHRASRSQNPLCVIMFEVDNFKVYNNTFGHDAGDYVLRKVADTMRANLRRSDFPCRYGGDEFTLLLPETTLEDGAHRAEELRKSIEVLALSYNNQALGQVTVRMGVAAYPKHGETGEVVLKVADEASYRARAIGKNCVVVAE